MFKKVFAFILFTSLSLSNVELSLGEYDYSINSVPIYYNSDSEIYGFQFASNHNPEVLELISASGGISEENGFSISSNATTGIVLGFSFTGTTLPSGTHHLINLNFDVLDGSSITDICLDLAVFSGASGLSLDVNEGLCITYTPPPVELSLGEYNHSNNTIDLYASSPYDISGFQFNVDSSSLTLSGASGGAAGDAGFQLSTDSDTGVTLGFSMTGSSVPAGEDILLVTLSFTVDSSEEADICLNGVVFSGVNANALYTTGPDCAFYTPSPVDLSLGTYNNTTNSINLYASSPYDIHGFQFNVVSSSLTLSGASGGAAGDAGFQLSTSSDTGVTLGFSMTGSSVPAGEDILLVTLSFTVDSSEEADICLNGVVFSGSGGASLYTTGPDCATYTSPPVELSLGDELVDGLVQVVLNSPYSLAGFQFDVSSESVELSSASGGAAGDAGFQVSNSASTVLGFSLTGAEINAGSYALIELAFEGTGTDEICIENIILSGPGGSNLPVANSGCQEYNFNEPEVVIVSPSEGDLFSDAELSVSVQGSGLSDGDHFHAYLDGTSEGMFDSEDFEITLSASGYHSLEVIIANGSHIEYDGELASDSVEFGFAFPGDYNLDSQVNILDLVATTQYVLYGSEDADYLQIVGADYNGDGNVNILDLVATTQFILFG